MNMPDVHHLLSTYVRLRPDASVETLPVDDTFWPRVADGALGNFRNEYLVSCYDFDRDWDSWENHPHGDEIVCLLAGATTFVMETIGGERRIELREGGSFLVVPKNTWHTAKVGVPSRALFITAGEDTQQRPV